MHTPFVRPSWAAVATLTALVALTAACGDAADGARGADASVSPVDASVTCISRAVCPASDAAVTDGAAEDAAPSDARAGDAGDEAGDGASAGSESEDDGSVPDPGESSCVSVCLGGPNDGKPCCGVNLTDSDCASLGLPACDMYCQHCE